MPTDDIHVESGTVDWLFGPQSGDAQPKSSDDKTPEADVNVEVVEAATPSAGVVDEVVEDFTSGVGVVAEAATAATTTSLLENDEVKGESSPEAEVESEHSVATEANQTEEEVRVEQIEEEFIETHETYRDNKCPPSENDKNNDDYQSVNIEIIEISKKGYKINIFHCSKHFF